MEILLTGVTGFIGQALLPHLLKKKYNVRAAVRSVNNLLSGDVVQYPITALSRKQRWENIVNGVQVVIHCAGLATVGDLLNPLEALREVNTYATLNLAKQAAASGVKRFIFISSIKVNGESTELGWPFKPNDQFIPIDPYGLSKYEAEVGLRKIAAETGMEVVVIRPPLVYGPGVKANFAAMMKWVNKGIPLPFGGITENRRSFVSLDNLADLIVICIEHRNAADQTFLVSDDEDLSTAQLLLNMANALDVTSRLLPIPCSWLTCAAKIIAKPAITQRLCGSLQVDISKTKELLSWQLPYSAAESMKKTANAFLENLNK